MKEQVEKKKEWRSQGNDEGGRRMITDKKKEEGTRYTDTSYTPLDIGSKLKSRTSRGRQINTAN